MTYSDYTETMSDLVEEKAHLMHRGMLIEKQQNKSYRDLIQMRKICKEIVLIEEEMEEVERDFKRAMGYLR